MDQKPEFHCPNCGVKLGEHSRQVCIHCGYIFATGTTQMNVAYPTTQPQFIPQQAIPQQAIPQGVQPAVAPGVQPVAQQPVSQNTTPQPAKPKGKFVLFLVLSLLNAFTGIPVVFMFGVLWLVFGAFSGDAVLYYSLLAGCGIYIVVSGVTCLISIINAFMQGRMQHRFRKVLVTSVIICAIIPFAFNMWANNYSRGNIVETKVPENAVLYQDDAISVTQKKLDYKGRGVDYIFTIQGATLETPYITNKVRINRCFLNAATIKASAEDANTYILSINYSDLKSIYVNTIESLDMDLSLTDASGNRIKKTIKADIPEDETVTPNYPGENLLYQNEFFSLYYKPIESVSYFDLFIVSNTEYPYTVSFDHTDFDTPANINSINNEQELALRDYSIHHTQINFAGWEDALGYVKANYTIRDESNYQEITSGIIDVSYEEQKIKRIYTKEA